MRLNGLNLESLIINTDSLIYSELYKEAVENIQQSEDIVVYNIYGMVSELDSITNGRYIENPSWIYNKKKFVKKAREYQIKKITDTRERYPRQQYKSVYEFKSELEYARNNKLYHVDSLANSSKTNVSASFSALSGFFDWYIPNKDSLGTVRVIRKERMSYEKWNSIWEINHSEAEKRYLYTAYSLDSVLESKVEIIDKPEKKNVHQYFRRYNVPHYFNEEEREKFYDYRAFVNYSFNENYQMTEYRIKRHYQEFPTYSNSYSDSMEYSFSYKYNQDQKLISIEKYYFIDSLIKTKQHEYKFSYVNGKVNKITLVFEPEFCLKFPQSITDSSKVHFSKPGIVSEIDLLTFEYDEKGHLVTYQIMSYTKNHNLKMSVVQTEEKGEIKYFKNGLPNLEGLKIEYK